MVFTLADPALTLLGAAACLGMTVDILEWITTNLKSVFDDNKRFVSKSYEHQRIIGSLVRTLLSMAMYTPHTARHEAKLGRNVAIFVCCDGNHHLNQLGIVRRVLRNRGVRVSVIVVAEGTTVPDVDEEEGDKPVIVRVAQTKQVAGTGKVLNDFDLVWSVLSKDIPDMRSRAPEIEQVFDEQGVGVVVNLFAFNGLLYHMATNERRPIVNISTHYRLEHTLCGFCQYLEIMRFAQIHPLAPVDDESGTVIPPLICPSHFELGETEDEGEDFYLCYATNNSVIDALLKAAEHIENKLYVFLHFDVEKTRSNVEVRRAPDPSFKKLMSKCKGVVTTGGNGVVWEAVVMGKPVISIPIPGHDEQMLSAKYNSSRFAGVRACFSLDDVHDAMMWLTDPDFDAVEYAKQGRNVRTFINQMDLRLAEAILDHDCMK